MSMTFIYQLAIVPAFGITLVSILVQRDPESENAQRRLLFFLLGLAVLLNASRYVALQIVGMPNERPYFELSNALAPSLLGITAIILLKVKEFAKMERNDRITAVLLGLVLGVLYALLWDQLFGLEIMIFPGILILAMGWALGRRFQRVTLLLGLLSMVVYVSFNWSMVHQPDYAGLPYPQVLGALFSVVFFITPSLSMVVAALLVTGSFHADASSRLSKLLKIGFSIALVFGMAYTIFWGSIWDSTRDGLFGIFALQPTSWVAIGAGMLMTLALHGRQRLAGLAFLVVVPIILYQSFEGGWRTSYHGITENRSARIARALDKFYTREGYYPQALDALTPRDLLFIQQPVILAGEKWCYESGGNYYRLSAFYREFFSAPVSLRVYESAGEVPSSPPICEERLAEMKKKYYSPMEDPNAMQPPIPTPLPDIEVGLPKIEIGTLLDGAVALPASWSPDGKYFLFETQSNRLELHFVIGETGDVCTADIQFPNTDGIRENTAWLPDGRLLYIESSGEMTILTPCQPGSEKLTVHLPEDFKRIMASSQESGRILLESQGAFWILDGHTLELMRIPDITPNPYELHWDTSTWLAGGEQLIIGRLNGRKGSNEGATLYLIDGATGEAQNSLDLEGEFGQSAPWMEALTEEKVLYQTQGEWLMADFGAQPVSITNVLEDIFGLDVNFPDEISASGSYLDSDGNGYYITVRLNHPHNQSTYLYYSRTGQVYVYEHEYHTLLLFPDGYSMDMQKLETVPTYQDIYDIVRVDDPETVYPQLTITGHTPREYPRLDIEYLPKRSQLAVASAHGVSLVSLPNGEMLAYWTLAGDGYSPRLTASPDGSALIASKDLGGLYYIPLP